VYRFEEPGDSWIGNSRATYVLLRPNARAEQLAKKIDAVASELIRQEHLAEGYTPHEGDFYRWALQPLGDGATGPGPAATFEMSDLDSP